MADNLAKAEQVRDIMEMLRFEQDRVRAEHRATPPTFFGKPTKKHHELVGQSRILKKLHTDLLKVHGRLLGVT